MKEYPLEIETLIDGDNGDRLGYYSKGHHDPSAFVAAIKERENEDWAPERVRHDWSRMAIVSGADGWERCLYSGKPGRRGVFPVTVIEW